MISHKCPGQAGKQSIAKDLGAGIVGFVVVAAVLGTVSYRLIDAGQADGQKRSWLPLLGVVGVIAVGTLLAYLWQYFV
jgi:preprotein translocase subunit SecD